jgi:hypothetical protein
MRGVHIFLGADLRAGHEGLAAICRKERVDLSSLHAGDCVIFINARRDKFKAYSPNGVVSYYKSPDPRRLIDITALNAIPLAINGRGVVDYPRALRASLIERLKLPRKSVGLEKI